MKEHKKKDNDFGSLLICVECDNYSQEVNQKRERMRRLGDGGARAP